MPPDRDEELEALRGQNLALGEQVKRLIRTESRLYRVHRQLDQQLRWIGELNAFALDARKVSEPRELLSRALRLLFRLFPFEEGVAFLIDVDGRVAPRVAEAFDGCAPLLDVSVAVPSWELSEAEVHAMDRPRVFRASEIPRGFERLVGAMASAFGAEPMASYAALPLRGSDHPIGLLVVRRRTASTTFHRPLPTADETPMLDLISRHAEAALESALASAELDARVQERTAELASVNARLDANLRRLQETQEQLVHAGKMAAIGTLTAGLSHELNNPLAVILGFAQRLLRETAPEDRSYGALRAIERQVQRCVRLVSALLDSTRRGTPHRERIAPARILEQVAALAGGTDRHRVTLSFVAEPDLPDMNANGSEIESALINLLSNALDATAQGGSIEVRAIAATRDARRGVEICVADSGTGIAPEILPQVCDPFFTTKEVGKGTGLGLSMCRQIVERHSGDLRIESELGKGTTVRVWLPAAQDDPAE
jgi:signal transduction histidine kinase